MTKKKCSKCPAVLPDTPEHFFRCATKANPDRLSTWCKKCAAIKKREYHLKSLYGLNIEDFRALIHEQGGRCPVCTGLLKLRDFGSGRRGHTGNVAHVDHCHETGAIRGVLCNNCNRALGLLGDSVDCLRRALTYLGVKEM